MKPTLFASIAMSVLVSGALAAPVSAAEPLRLIGPQMDTITAGAGVHVISRANGSHSSSSYSKADSSPRGAKHSVGKRSVGVAKGHACCGPKSFIKLLVKKHGLSFGKFFRSSRFFHSRSFHGGISGKLVKRF